MNSPLEDKISIASKMLGAKKNETMKGLDGTHIYDLNESQLSIYAAD